MRKLHIRKGSSYLLVIVVFLFVSLITAIMVTGLNQSIYHSHAYALQMRAYYLTGKAADATVAVLLADDNELLKDLPYPKEDSMTHMDGSHVVGLSKIKLTKETHSYYGENKEWIVAAIETTIPEQRGSRTGKSFTYTGTVMILVENPLIQLYNINPDIL